MNHLENEKGDFISMTVEQGDAFKPDQNYITKEFILSIIEEWDDWNERAELKNWKEMKGYLAEMLERGLKLWK